MSSDEKKIVSSVEDVISAVAVLLNDIRSNPDLEQEQKKMAMEKVGAVTDHLKDIHQVLFVKEMEETQSLADPLVVTNLTETLSQALYTKTDRLDEQDNGDASSESTKLRLVVTPEKRPEEEQDQKEEPQKLPKTPDNLALIKGVEEQTQEVLNEQEVFHFEEIAAFKEADVVRISNLLEDPFRVARENWIEQAALLAKDVQTKYSLTLEGQAGFDRLSWVSAYNWQQAEFEQDLNDENEIIHDEPPTVISHEAQAAINHDLVLKEKALLEAELASLREQLSAQTKQATEHGVNAGDLEQPYEEPQEAFDDNVTLSPRLQKVFEEPITEQEEEMPQESSEFHTEPEEVQDGAMWHEEVSLAPDYVPPIVEEENPTADVEESQVDEPAYFDDQENEMPADFIEDGDITLPHTRKRQDEYVNKVYSEASFSEQNQDGEQQSFEEAVSDPHLQNDLSSLAETIDLPEERHESVEQFAPQDILDRDEQTPPHFEAESDAPAQPDQKKGSMPPPIPVMNGTPPVPPHTHPPFGKAGAQDGLQNPALRQMDPGMNGQDNQTLRQNGLPQPPAPPVPLKPMPQNPAPHRPQGPAGQMPLPQGHPGQYAGGFPPIPPGQRPVMGTPHMNGQQLQHPRARPPGSPARVPPQDLRQDLPLNSEQHASEFTHAETFNDQRPEKKKKPEVSAGFRLKAKQFTESLQRSFGTREE